MIINLLINLILLIFGSIFVFLPEVTLASIPVAGSLIETILTSMVTAWNAFLVLFPYGRIAWNVFLAIIIPFEITMLIAKFFLGSRTPSHNVN